MKKINLGETYHFSLAQILKFEKHYGAVYMGAWSLVFADGNSSVHPVEVFYQPNPDTEKGHPDYFGLYARSTMFGETRLVICNAASAFTKPIWGLEENGTIYASRYTHDFVKTPSGNSIDGARDYLKYSTVDESSVNLKLITVKNDKFFFDGEEVEKLIQSHEENK